MAFSLAASVWSERVSQLDATAVRRQDILKRLKTSIQSTEETLVALERRVATNRDEMRQRQDVSETLRSFLSFLFFSLSLNSFLICILEPPASSL